MLLVLQGREKTYGKTPEFEETVIDETFPFGYSKRLLYIRIKGGVETPPCGIYIK